MLWTSIEHNGDGLSALDLPHLDQDVLQEVMVAGVEADLGYSLAQQPGGQGLLFLSTGVDLQGLEAGVDELVHVLGLEVLLGLGRVHDEVAAAVVPVDRAPVAAEDGIIIRLLLFVIHQVKCVWERFWFDLVCFCLHFLQIILIGILRSKNE